MSLLAAHQNPGTPRHSGRAASTKIGFSVLAASALAADKVPYQAIFSLTPATAIEAKAIEPMNKWSVFIF